MNNVLARPLPGDRLRNSIISVSKTVSPRLTWVMFFLLLHIPLVLLMHRVPMVATIHALAALFIGLSCALFSRRLEWAAYSGAYIVGSEVLWRMMKAQVFWEFGKYAIALIFIVAILRNRTVRDLTLLPFLFFALLLPSIWLTFASAPVLDLREQLSFNLSGPFALMVSVWFFSGLKLTTAQLQRLLLALIGPALGIAVSTLSGVLENPDISFGSGSNMLASGEFAPNQVAAALGLGVLFALFSIFNDKASYGHRLLMFGCMALMAVQSALTFSRSGLYNAAGGGILAALYLLKDPRSRVRLVLVTVLVVITGYYFVLPRLDEFTGGALSARFQNTSLTGRDELFWDEVRIWKENPLFGVGPGLVSDARDPALFITMNHTEFSRLFAEHGVFGFAAIILLVVMSVQSYQRAPTNRGKALVIALLTWCFLYMVTAAMRLAAPSFVFGLAWATLLPDKRRALVAVVRQKNGRRTIADKKVKELVPIH